MIDPSGSLPSADNVANGDELMFEYEAFGKSKVRLKVTRECKVLHRDTLNLWSASALRNCARAVSKAASVDPAEVEARLRELADEIDNPAGPNGPDDSWPTIGNVGADGLGSSIDEIDAKLKTLTAGWPKRVGNSLFAPNSTGGPFMLDSTDKLFAWFDARARVDWKRGDDRVTQERYDEHLRMTADAFEAVETLPHWPRMPGNCYLHKELPKSNGAFLEELLDFFVPATTIDRYLIASLFATPAWGGRAGARPIFLIEGPEGDGAEMGRGVGKSMLSEIVGHLYGGHLEVSQNDEINQMKTRLLSPAAQGTRIVRLDNVKSHRFSWADLEGLITAPTISGHRLYVGEGRRPNTLTWIITLNGASLSKDLALRVVLIRLGRPDNDAGWLGRLRAFIDAHRWEILRDIGDRLKAEGKHGYQAGTRWAEWEAGVLAKGPLPVSSRKLILARQTEADADAGERELVVGEFREQLRRRGHNPNRDKLFIKARLAADWLSEASRTNYTTSKASAHLKTLGLDELVPGVKSNGVMGWEWRGAKAEPDGKRQHVKELPLGMHTHRNHRESW